MYKYERSFFCALFFLKILVLTTILIHTSESLDVLDKNNLLKNKKHEEVVIADYCPKMPHCKDGEHVLCMSNPNIVGDHSPFCHLLTNISMDVNMARTIVRTINRVRQRAALGIETGKDGVKLPRAYGLPKIQWDSELATFAQVHANQCRPRVDLCRASYRFPNVYQSITYSKASYPWFGFENHEKLYPKVDFEFLNKALNKWYQKKNLVDEEMIYTSSDPLISYLNIVNGRVTHVGCGLSTFVDVVFSTSTLWPFTNANLLVCNFSNVLVKGIPTYLTDNHADNNLTQTCGCPAGFEEEEDTCLCKEKPEIIDVTDAPKIDDCRQNHGPRLVLLPLIRARDATPEEVQRALLSGIGKRQFMRKQLKHLRQIFSDPNSVIPNKNDYTNHELQARKHLTMAKDIPHRKDYKEVNDNYMTDERRMYYTNQIAHILKSYNASSNNQESINQDGFSKGHRKSLFVDHPSIRKEHSASHESTNPSKLLNLIKTLETEIEENYLDKSQIHVLHERLKNMYSKVSEMLNNQYNLSPRQLSSNSNLNKSYLEQVFADIEGNNVDSAFREMPNNVDHTQNDYDYKQLKNLVDHYQGDFLLSNNKIKEINHESNKAQEKNIKYYNDRKLSPNTMDRDSDFSLDMEDKHDVASNIEIPFHRKFEGNYNNTVDEFMKTDKPTIEKQNYNGLYRLTVLITRLSKEISNLNISEDEKLKILTRLQNMYDMMNIQEAISSQYELNGEKLKHSDSILQSETQQRWNRRNEQYDSENNDKRERHSSEEKLILSLNNLQINQADLHPTKHKRISNHIHEIFPNLNIERPHTRNKNIHSQYDFVTAPPDNKYEIKRKQYRKIKSLGKLDNYPRDFPFEHERSRSIRPIDSEEFQWVPETMDDYKQDDSPVYVPERARAMLNF
ncbi:hypothetical protein JYU34_019251 [Plutella xylostella]|uniref:SCP domain-containing protein n=1 Tax=Plutella xylostella TaxID=51655 RepID=A0ABQ7PWL3_PLUXY|nr:hypothetical protein JYU34_019251 [Plutella xylostella]